MSTVSVTILGCSSATPTADRHPSSQLVIAGDVKMLIDCGEGTQVQLLRFHIKYNKIDYILISHLHGDHFLGLPGLLSTMSLNGRLRPLVIISPPGLQELIQHFLRVSETVLNFEISYIETSSDGLITVLEKDSFRINTFPMKHRIPCCGFIIEEKKLPRKINPEQCNAFKVPIEYYPILKAGKDYFPVMGEGIPNEKLTIAASLPVKYGYCSDTIYDEDLLKYISKVNLLYHEATFLDQMSVRASETYHTTALQAGLLANKAGVGKLLIGHFSARYAFLEVLLQEARLHFDNTELALEGKTFVVV